MFVARVWAGEDQASIGKRPLSSIGLLYLPARHPFEGSHLPEEPLPRLGWATNQGRSWWHVRHHARLRPDPGTRANAQVSGQGGLPTDLDEVLKHRRARNAHLCHDHAAAAKADVVRNLHQIIEA